MKTYSKPEFLLVRMDCADIIATSTSFVVSDQQTSAQLGAERGNPIWE